MKTSRLVLWFLSLTALSILTFMNVWTVPDIREAAGGIRIFDNRPFGYSLADAQAFLRALEPEGKAIYQGIQRHLDTVFPVTFMIAMPWALWLMSTSWPRQLRYFAVLCGTLGPICDLTENYFVGEMLRLGPDAIDAELVLLSSQFSVTKWVLDLLAVACFVILGWSYLLERWRLA